MKILYYDCFSGISGDMNLGALIDLGVSPNYLKGELKKLAVGDYKLKITKDSRKGIWGTNVEVAVSFKHKLTKRTFKNISGLINKSSLSANVKKISLNIFTKLARAEGKVHNCDPQQVHFHEIGAIDSIVDIVGAAICLDSLSPDLILSSPVELGGGFVHCAHGTLPVPAPATVEILKGVPVKSGAVPYETTTPTGAAILAVNVSEFTDKLSFTVQKIGYGIGKRDTELPNVLRVYLGEKQPQTEDAENQTPLLMECNIDDMNPELYEDMMEAFFTAGAHDVFLTPIIMKKSRPAVKISVLCDDKKRKAIEEIFWLRTSTFGLRYQQVNKTILPRDFSMVSTKYGNVTLKNGYWQGRKIKSKPEYEDCRRLAKEKGVSVREIYDTLLLTGQVKKGK